ncbi:MAG: hypothetical protein HQL56_03185 [Magnetococcales bacterium]|nr:hypothetical protein [Magnetococcales bacterium]
MSLSINAKVVSLAAQRDTQRYSHALGGTFRRLAADIRGLTERYGFEDEVALPSGLGVRIRNLNQALQDANDGISVSQLAADALGETLGALQRLRDLAASGDETVDGPEHHHLQLEVSQLMTEIDRIANDTQYEGFSLLDESVMGRRMAQTGEQEDGSVAIRLAKAAAQVLELVRPNNPGGRISEGPQALQAVDAALHSVADVRSAMDLFQSRFESSVTQLQRVPEALSGEVSPENIQDLGEHDAKRVRDLILQRRGKALLAHSPPSPGLIFKLLE